MGYYQKCVQRETSEKRGTHDILLLSFFGSEHVITIAKGVVATIVHHNLN